MGKMALLIVLGSYFILGSIMRKNNDISTDTVSNVVSYYTMINAKHISSSGANLAASSVFKDTKWRKGFTNSKFSGGILNVKLQDMPSFGPGGVRIISVGEYLGYKDSVVVDLNLSYFSKFLYFADEFPSNGYFVTGDTIAGRFHTNQRLNVSGRPVFLGRVSMKNGPEKRSNWFGPPDPQFIGGYEYGVEIPMPGSLDGLKSSAQKGGYFTKDELWITFNNNNTVSIRKSATGLDSTFNINTLAPNGLLYSEKDLHIKGKVAGRFTVASKNNIWLDDDVGVVDDPKVNPSSTQMLGICAQKNAIITRNIPNALDINITAAVYTGESFYAQDYNKIPNAGFINLYGSLTQKKAGFTGAGQASGGGKVKNGYNENYKYDERLILSAPPEFPITDRMQILAWWE